MIKWFWRLLVLTAVVVIAWQQNWTDESPDSVLSPPGPAGSQGDLRTADHVDGTAPLAAFYSDQDDLEASAPSG